MVRVGYAPFSSFLPLVMVAALNAKHLAIGCVVGMENPSFQD